MTSALDQKGLEAATDAYNEFECGSDVDHVRKIVRAYLSTVTPAEIAGLVERLRQYEGRQWETTACYNGTRDEAASLIQSQAARIAELEAGIRGLLDCPDIADNDHKDEETHVAERAARAALATQEQARVAGEETAS